MMSALLAIVISLIVGYAWGWGSAHNTVAKECKRLGRFYVGMNTFYVDKITHENDGKGGIPPPPRTNPNKERP